MSHQHLRDEILFSSAWENIMTSTFVQTFILFIGSKEMFKFCQK